MGAHERAQMRFRQLIKADEVFGTQRRMDFTDAAVAFHGHVERPAFIGLQLERIGPRRRRAALAPARTATSCAGHLRSPSLPPLGS